MRRSNAQPLVVFICAELTLHFVYVCVMFATLAVTSAER